ncbi:hypothetical protein [Arcicella rosea]|uniref:DUF3325 domain-containing protein n=1 Tax=Arcicella rosea TaxID=502909 RepID=A0A841ESZ3_9BACT|nr:hypothetical protein [Arcicella rosea]MBB6003788.1 hypothetical protein [Arcicella rosea]
MIAIYFNLMGILLYYSETKYFPKNIQIPNLSYQKPISLLICIIGLAIFINQWGWMMGLLMSLCSLVLLASVCQLFAVLGKKWFIAFLVFVHCLLILNLFSYAS